MFLKRGRPKTYDFEIKKIVEISLFQEITKKLQVVSFRNILL